MASSIDVNISNSQSGDIASVMPDITIDSAITDGATGTGDTVWQIDDWPKWLGYYRKYAAIKQVVDLRVEWVAGAGYETPVWSKVILDRINFLPILKNMLRTRRIGGVAYCEKVTDSKGALLALKPLDPASMQIVVNSRGALKEYRQVSRTSKGKTIVFKPSEMFVLYNRKIADEIGAQGDIAAVEDLILADNEAFVIQKQIVKNFARPKLLVEVDEDDPDKVLAFMKLFDETTATGNNIGFPKGTVAVTPLITPPAALSATLPQRAALRDQFFTVMNTPQILSGGGGAAGGTESFSKVVMTAHEQSVKAEQLEVETEVLNQLFFEIKLGASVSLRPDLQQDIKKDGATQQMDFQEGEVTV